MRRFVPILLSALLALASFASAVHANSHQMAGGHAEDGAVKASMLAPSCCTGEVQLVTASCISVVAILPVRPDLSRGPACVPAPAFDTERLDGLHPERLLDPPRL